MFSSFQNKGIKWIAYYEINWFEHIRIEWEFNFSVRWNEEKLNNWVNNTNKTKFNEENEWISE